MVQKWHLFVLVFSFSAQAQFAQANPGDKHQEFGCAARVYKRSIDLDTEFEDVEMIEKVEASDVHAVEISTDFIGDKDGEEEVTLFLPKMDLYATVNLRTFPISSLVGTADERMLSMNWYLYSGKDYDTAERKVLYSGGAAVTFKDSIPLTKRTISELIAMMAQKISSTSNYSYQLSCVPLRV
ncbi:MAG: hypothetical protein K2X47_13585, partial [Bdellovibrionales bacterium]|nr:hypothetical protein [Bdellovibrionales bacterium]